MGLSPRGAGRVSISIEPQFGGNRGVVAGARAMVASRLDRPVTVRREDLVEASVAAELAGAQARRLYGNGQVSVSANTTFDHSHYASRAPGPSLVRAVDIRGPRSSLATAARRSANKPKASKRHRRDKNTTSPDYSPHTDSSSSPPAASYASSAPAFGRQASAAARAPAGPAPRAPPPSEPRGAALPF